MAPSRTALLALCLVLAVSAAAAAVQPASKCRSTKKGLLGGWEAVKKVPEEAYQAILINLVENGNSTWVPCDEPKVNLRQACSQVVAGQNVELLALLSCPDVDSSVLVKAEVFVPLPAADTEPEVTSLEIRAVDGKTEKPAIVVV